MTAFLQLSPRPGVDLGAPALSSTGLEVLLLGNADIVCEWVPTVVEPGGTPLAIYPTPADLDLIGGDK